MSGEMRELIKQQKADGHFFYCNKCGAAYEGPPGKNEHPNCSYVAVEGVRDIRAQRLAAVCEELLKEHPERECEGRAGLIPCADLHVSSRCQPCRDRALLERCDRKARGEK